MGFYLASTATHEGCPVRVKTRCIRIPQGVTATVEWEMRDNNGDPMDLSEYWPEISYSLSPDPETLAEIQVRFVTVEQLSSEFSPVAGEIVDPSTGLIRFAVPYDLTRRAGIYRFNVGVVTEKNEVVLIDGGLLVIEPTLWGDPTQVRGLPTIQEIRDYIRDTAVENDLLRDVEFDDAEIVLAMISSVRKWNETPPRVVCYSCDNFPYRDMWMQGVFAHLYLGAATWYSRNNLQASHGGLTVQDRAKAQEYLNYAAAFMRNWQLQVIEKKIEINVSRCIGSIP